MKRIAIAALFVILCASVAFSGTIEPSGYTAQVLVDRARLDVNDAETVFATDAEFIRWADEAVKYIVASTRCLEATEVVTLVTSIANYSVTTSHYDVEAAMYDASSSDTIRFYFLDKIEPQLIYTLPREKGRPLYWWEWAGYVWFWPVPDADRAGKTVDLFLVTKPTGLTAASSAIETPYYFDDTILLYMKAKYYEKDMKEGKATYYRNLFYQTVERYGAEVRKKLVPKPPAE